VGHPADAERKEDIMAGVEVKPLSAPDETRPFADKGQAEVVRVGGTTILRGTFEPGWRWSQHVKPLAGTASCQAAHTGYVVSGRMHIRMDDGTEQEMGAGDAVYLPAGHDAWIVGDEPCVFIDFTAPDYAKQS
jgi:quercetin dioxygenase-like cupin family protein